MGKQFYTTGSPSGYQYDNNQNGTKQGNVDAANIGKKYQEDGDLIIEDNTVYEIDRECYERLKRQRRNKVQDKKSK